jgi:hypothetical protein
VSTLARPIVTETNLSPEILDENRTHVDVDAGSPQVSGLISIDRSPTVTGAVPSRPQTEPNPGTDATPPDDKRNAQLSLH